MAAARLGAHPIESHAAVDASPALLAFAAKTITHTLARTVVGTGIDRAILAQETIAA